MPAEGSSGICLARNCTAGAVGANLTERHWLIFIKTFWQWPTYYFSPQSNYLPHGVIIPENYLRELIWHILVGTRYSLESWKSCNSKTKLLSSFLALRMMCPQPLNKRRCWCLFTKEGKRETEENAGISTLSRKAYNKKYFF